MPAFCQKVSALFLRRVVFILDECRGFQIIEGWFLLLVLERLSVRVLGGSFINHDVVIHSVRPLDDSQHLFYSSGDERSLHYGVDFLLGLCF